MPMPSWLATYIAARPHTLHGDYAITHEDGEEGPDYPVVTAYHAPTGIAAGTVHLMPHDDLLAPGEQGAPEAPTSVDLPDGSLEYLNEPPGWSFHPGGFWRKRLGHKVWNVHVHPEHRRKGVASAMYEHAEKHIGPVLAGDVQTDEGAAFRSSLKKSELHKAVIDHLANPEFQSWFGGSKMVDDTGKPRVFYRGTRRPGVMNGHLDTLSFADSPDVGSIYAGTPDAYGNSQYGSGANVFPVHLNIKNPLTLRGPQMSFKDLLTTLRYGEPNGVTHDEAKRFLNYLINRKYPRDPWNPKIKAGDFDYSVYDTPPDEDPDAEEQEADIGDLLHSRSSLHNFRDDFDWDNSSAGRLHVDTFALVDAPRFRAVASRLGHDGVVHDDVFNAAGTAGTDLLGKEPHQLQGVSQHHGSVKYSHRTYRPFEQHQVRGIFHNGAVQKSEQQRFPFLIGPDKPPKQERVHHVDSPEFQQWFGTSKATDHLGKPMRVYHGTTAPQFRQFNVGEPRVLDENEGATEWGSGADPSAYVGSHFAEEPRVASKFAGGLYGRESTKGGHVYPVYLRALNPKHYDNEDDFQRDLYRQHVAHSRDLDDYLQAQDEDLGDDFDDRYDNDPEFREETNRNAITWTNGQDNEGEGHSSVDFARDLAEAYRTEMSKLGHDSIRYKNKAEGGTSWAVFEPHQIKSAIGNDGSFDVRNPDIGKSEGFLALGKSEQEKHPTLVGDDGVPKYSFHFKLDEPERLHDLRPLTGYLEVRHHDEPVGVLGFDQDEGSKDAVHVHYIGAHPEHRGRGLGTVMLKRFRSWMGHHRPGVKYLQGEITNRGAMRFMNRNLGEPLYLADAIKRYSVDAALKELPEKAPEDTSEKLYNTDGWHPVDSGNYFHSIHWMGRGQRPTVHPWADDTQKSLKDEIMDRALLKLGRLSKNLSRLPMPFAKPRHNISWPLGALDWRNQKMKVMHRDGEGGQPTGAGWVQVQDGQVLSQDGHPISARNPAAR